VPERKIQRLEDGEETGYEADEDSGVKKLEKGRHGDRIEKIFSFFLFSLSTKSACQNITDPELRFGRAKLSQAIVFRQYLI
jgi:hypothetical protein